jgi:uncharacterized protein YbcI
MSRSGTKVICFLEDIYTPVERTLIAAGRFPAVQETRSAFQDTMREKFSAAVEEVVGRNSPSRRSSWSSRTMETNLQRRASPVR